MRKSRSQKRAVIELFLLFGVYFICTTAVFALEIPPPSGNYVNDYASFLNAEAKQRLETRLRKFGAETTTQIVVVTFPSLEDENVEDFTNRLYEAWRIGLGESDNGVLLAIFQKERRVRIEVGYGLEGVLTDALAAQIISNEIVPNFRAGNPTKGIESAVVAIEKAVRGEYKAPEKKTNPIPSITAFLVILILLFFMSRMSRRGFTIGPTSRRRNYWGGGFYPFGGWTRHSGGFGGTRGGGDFPGFSGGGGLSGGGGASGSW